MIILKILNPNDQNYIRQTVESLAMADLLALPDLSQGEDCWVGRWYLFLVS